MVKMPPRYAKAKVVHVEYIISAIMNCGFRNFILFENGIEATKVQDSNNV